MAEGGRIYLPKPEVSYDAYLMMLSNGLPRCGSTPGLMHSVPLESCGPRTWREADDHTDLFSDPVESKPHDPVSVQRRLAFIQLGGVAHFGQVNLIFRIVAPAKIRSPRSAPSTLTHLPDFGSNR